MPDLTADDVQKTIDTAKSYSDEVNTLAKDNGVDITKVTNGNDPSELLKAAGAAAATGAAVGAAVGAAFPVLLPFTTAAGAIIGALAGFFAKFKFGSAEGDKLSAEWQKLNQTISAVLDSVPQPQRDQLGHIILDGMRRTPGPLPFCLTAGEGGCVMTSMQGARDAAAGIDQHVRDLAAQAEAVASAKASRRLLWIAIGIAAAGGIGYAGWRYEGKRK